MAVGDPAGVGRSGSSRSGWCRCRRSGCRGGQALQLVGVGALGGEQGPLVGDAPGVAGQAAVAADHPVAGDQHRDRVAAQGRPDRPDRRRLAELAGHPGVRADLAAGDLLGLGEHGPLELGGAAQVVAGRRAPPPGVQEPLDLGDQLRRGLVGRPQRPPEPGLEPLGEPGLVAARGGGRDAPAVVGDQQRPGRPVHGHERVGQADPLQHRRGQGRRRLGPQAVQALGQLPPAAVVGVGSVHRGTLPLVPPGGPAAAAPRGARGS